jgi:hypothetical protein
VNKKEYGEVPAYLTRRKQETDLLHQAEMQREAARKEEENKRFQLLSEEDRLKVLAGLTAKWEKLNSDYQKLSLTVDTVPKINR